MIIKFVCFIAVGVVGYLIGWIRCQDKLVELESKLEYTVDARRLKKYLQCLRLPEPSGGCDSWNGCLNAISNWVDRQ